MKEYTKYFKDKKGYDRFITKIYEKYQSISRFSGTIKLNCLNDEEAYALSRLFGENYNSGDDVKISIKQFLKIMDKSKFKDFDITTFITEYLNVSLLTNKELKSNLIIAEDNFYQELIKDNLMLKKIINKDNLLIHHRYVKNKQKLKNDLINIINLLNHLPKEKTMISLYAATYTKDPHYLDLDSKTSNLFISCLSILDNIDFPNTREDKIKLLYKHNIEMDNLSNYVLTYNLLSSRKWINDLSKETLILNIQNILNTNSFDSKLKKVFIFENPSILTKILYSDIDISVIISGGFPNNAVYLLIDKLIENGNKIYYNGDFDPEGLIIANKLKNKYQDKLELFCYDKIDYDNCKSNKIISNKRLNKMAQINDSKLIIIKDQLLKNKLAAFQENNNRIINYLKDLN
ncbi:MAG TPA: DUF2399 domain-containing protein [Candidatus Faecisoma merdavium]|nr:DUF2399 domain-containing protein [Candidatus Faecisoma merdavium]